MFFYFAIRINQLNYSFLFFENFVLDDVEVNSFVTMSPIHVVSQIVQEAIVVCVLIKSLFEFLCEYLKITKDVIENLYLSLRSTSSHLFIMFAYTFFPSRLFLFKSINSIDPLWSFPKVSIASNALSVGILIFL